ncbi:nucleotide sugar dehydrogenase [uncultured Deinococcus sp.]|uniref:nucleotide sugar dehydrogenase n=1 Tax=uncultured Deinococcus sp. TaxID=158789 RepID=UPI0025FFB925|nr:nucleotide sugar dehydrogenase [uncultured Deinococcus sp.]
MIKTDLIAALVEKIQGHTARVGVVGLGYVGLPFLVEKAKVGFHVTGIDRSSERAGMVARGENYIGDVRDEDLRAVVDAGLVETTTAFDVVSQLDVIVICVPTPLDRNLTPDLSYVRSVTREIAACLRPGQLISLESTTYPGTTEDVMKPILEEGGLRAGVDFFLAYSPERVDPGNVRFTTKNTNKVVGGNDPVSLEVALAFYRQSIEHVVPVSSAKVAEMVKVYENTFRSVNIALVNELAMLCDRMNLSVWEVLDAAFTKPFGIMPFYPGPGVGGHCIPLDPHYLEWKAREYGFETRFITLAGEINRHMPEFAVNKVARLLNNQGKAIKGSRIIQLGMAYKRDVDDYRESPAIHVFEQLHKLGADISFYDPFISIVQEGSLTVEGLSKLAADDLRNADLVIITTPHTTVDYAWVLEHSKMVFDTRNATKGLTSSKITLL